MLTALKVLLYYLHDREGQRIFNCLEVKGNNFFGSEGCTDSLEGFLRWPRCGPCPGTVGNTPHTHCLSRHSPVPLALNLPPTSHNSKFRAQSTWPYAKNGHTGSCFLPVMGLITDTKGNTTKKEKLRVASWIFSQFMASTSAGISSSGDCMCVIAIHGHWWICPMGMSLNSFSSHDYSPISCGNCVAQGVNKTVLSGFVLKPCYLLMSLCAPRSARARRVPVLLQGWLRSSSGDPAVGQLPCPRGTQGSGPSFGLPLKVWDRELWLWNIRTGREKQLFQRAAPSQKPLCNERKPTVLC